MGLLLACILFSVFFLLISIWKVSLRFSFVFFFWSFNIKTFVPLLSFFFLFWFGGEGGQSVSASEEARAAVAVQNRCCTGAIATLEIFTSLRLFFSRLVSVFPLKTIKKLHRSTHASASHQTDNNEKRKRGWADLGHFFFFFCRSPWNSKIIIIIRRYWWCSCRLISLLLSYEFNCIGSMM